LFGAIDAGDPALNLPAYNGGLFAPETRAGRLLARYAIPDRFLALGLDRLCRDVDDKTHALVFVDFKSLGVRQLGSIYEGLLEFKLHIAGEKLAVMQGGGQGALHIPSPKPKTSACWRRCTRATSTWRTTSANARPPAAITRPTTL
jgi:hypothetical protein